MQRLLLIKTSSLGDVVHAFPVLTDLSRHCPDLSVDWLVEENLVDLPRLHPAVGRVIPVALRRWRHSLWSATTQGELQRLRQILDTHAHDASLDLQGLIKSALIGLYGPRQRLGYDWHSIREPLASLFYTQRFAVSRQQHAVNRNRQLSASALGYRIDTPVDYGLTKPLACPVGYDHPYFMFLHGTSRSDKEWPISQWIKLGQHLSASGSTILLPGGSPSEQQRARHIAQQIPMARALPSLDLTTLAALLSHAEGIVGVDTGLTHLATALNRPVVALYTATHPEATGVVGSCRATNLGGPGDCPDSETVIRTLEQLR